MVPAALAKIDCWIFDLDNTLYAPSARLFDLIDDRMQDYIANRLGVGQSEARQIQKRYFHDHGTTLAGMMAVHGVDPHEYLHFVHDVPMDRLSPSPKLAKRISALPGRKLVFTNGDAPYAEKVLGALGLLGIFEAVFDIHGANYAPKPDPIAYERLCDLMQINPRNAFFAEDMARNLVPAKKIGMTTLWIDNGSELGDAGLDHTLINYRTNDLEDWLGFGWDK